MFTQNFISYKLLKFITCIKLLLIMMSLDLFDQIHFTWMVHNMHDSVKLRILKIYKQEAIDDR